MLYPKYVAKRGAQQFKSLAILAAMLQFALVDMPYMLHLVLTGVVQLLQHGKNCFIARECCEFWHNKNLLQGIQ